MKTKQVHIRAVLGKNEMNGKNHADTKETVSQFYVIDKKTEKQIVVARCYMGRSSSASAVYASIWISGRKDGEEYYSAGSGSASGWGYHKESAAVQYAITSAGVELYGSAYRHSSQKPDFKKRAHIDGVGSSAIESALLAIAYAAGCKDAVFISC